MKIGALVLICLISFGAFGQQITSKAPKIPASFSLTKTVNHLIQHTKNDFEKVRNIYHWIAHHVKYDVEAYLTENTKDYTPQEVFKKKKGVCHNYAVLFEAMCKLAKLECHYIYGYTKPTNHEPGDQIIIDDHAWNVVKVQQGWYLIDVTWGSGYLDYRPQRLLSWISRIFNKPFMKKKLKFIPSYSEKYLFTKPEEFLKTHMPVHPMWQLKSCIFSMKSFEAGKLHKADSCFDYQYAINKYTPLDKIDQYLITAKKGISFNPHNHRIMAFASARYAANIYNTYLQDQELKLKYLKIAKNYFQKAILHGIQYKQDNYELYRKKKQKIRAEKQEDILSSCFYL